MGAIAPIDFEEGSICTHRFLEIPLWFCRLRGAMGQQNGNLHPSIRIPNDATELVMNLQLHTALVEFHCMQRNKLHGGLKAKEIQ